MSAENVGCLKNDDSAVEVKIDGDQSKIRETSRTTEVLGNMAFVLLISDEDSDGDGFTDWIETKDGYDPSNSISKPEYIRFGLRQRTGYYIFQWSKAGRMRPHSAAWVWIPKGYGDYYSLSEKAGYADYNLEVPSASTYAIWAV